MAEKLDDAAVAARLATLTEWQLDDKTISRRYRFRSFSDAMRFTNAVAELAEARNHHPFIAIDFKFVTLRLTSWHAGGLTEDDFSEAQAADALYSSHLL